MQKNKQIPLLYLFIYKVLKKKSNGGKYVTYECVRETMNRNFYHIPRRLHFYIIQELETYKLIRKSRLSITQIYEIIGGDVDRRLNQFNVIL